MRDLFEAQEGTILPLAPGAVLLRGFAGDLAQQLLADLRAVLVASPFRHLVTPGGLSRLAHHGVRPLEDGNHPATGRCRINLTFRRAG